MTLQQLRYIVTIVNCGSISEAAKQLFITQPSLSNSVKEQGDCPVPGRHGIPLLCKAGPGAGRTSGTALYGQETVKADLLHLHPALCICR